MSIDLVQKYLEMFKLLRYQRYDDLKKEKKLSDTGNDVDLIGFSIDKILDDVKRNGVGILDTDAYFEEGRDGIKKVYKEYKTKCKDTPFDGCFDMDIKTIGDTLKLLRKDLCAFIKTKIHWLDDKKKCGDIKGTIFLKLYSLVHSTYVKEFQLLFDHHICTLKTETVIETLCSFLGLVYSDRRKSMKQENLFKNTVCYISMKGRTSKERTQIIAAVALLYYEHYKRHGVITNERYLSQREYEDSKVIHRLEEMIQESIFKIPLQE
eukprot:227493_1